jgi:transcriptional regulator with XRE-family HTH domain
MENSKTPLTILFGLRVRSLRKSRGLSQEVLASLSELDRSYIGGVERGERNISLNNIFKIATALNLKIDKLFEDLYE